MCEIHRNLMKNRRKMRHLGQFSHFPDFSTALPPFPRVPLMNAARRTGRLEKWKIGDEPTMADFSASAEACRRGLIEALSLGGGAAKSQDKNSPCTFRSMMGGDSAKGLPSSPSHLSPFRVKESPRSLGGPSAYRGGGLVLHRGYSKGEILHLRNLECIGKQGIRGLRTPKTHTTRQSRQQ